jgi:hypothetical protein
MAGLKIDFRKAAIGLAILGAILGVAFGVGVAYGRGSPKTVDSGISQQQIQSLLGLSSGAGTGGGGFGGGASGAGANGLAALLGGGTAGVITAVTSNSITIETRQGSRTVTIAPTTNVETYSKTAAANLKQGDAVIVTGASGADGSIAAESISQLPDALKGIASGTGATGSSGPNGRNFQGGATGSSGTNGRNFQSGATGSSGATGR